MIEIDDIDNGSDLFYWNACVKAIAEGEMTLSQIGSGAQEQMAIDVQYFKEHREFMQEE